MSQKLARAIVNLYYLYNAKVKINLNMIINESSLGFKLGSPGPKVATLSLCYYPLTTLTMLMMMTFCMFLMSMFVSMTLKKTVWKFFVSSGIDSLHEHVELGLQGSNSIK